MKYKVRIKNKNTQEIRTCTMETLEWDKHSLFWWTDGNYGCDCNREIVFRRAGGEPELNEKEFKDLECGDNRFTVIEAILEDSTIISIDQKE